MPIATGTTRTWWKTFVGTASTILTALAAGHCTGSFAFWLCAYGRDGMALWYSNMLSQDRAIAAAMALYGAEPQFRAASSLENFANLTATALTLGIAGQAFGALRPITREQWTTFKANLDLEGQRRWPALWKAKRAVAATTSAARHCLQRRLWDLVGIVQAVPGRSWAWAAIALVGAVVALALFCAVFWGVSSGRHAVSWWLEAPLDRGMAIAAALDSHQLRVANARNVAILVGLVAFGLVLIGLGKLSGLTDGEPLYGAARFGTWREMVSGGLLDSARKQAGVVLGKWKRGNGKGPLVSHSADWTHVFVLGPTGCGKGQGFVLPNALSWPDSLIAFDLKGEAWEKSAGYRAMLPGSKVFYFNPTDTGRRTCRFNPLGHIDAGNAIQLVSELKKVAEMLIPVPETGEKFWAQSGQVGFVAAGMVVAERSLASGEPGESPQDPTGMVTVGRILEEIKRPDLQKEFTAIANNQRSPAKGKEYSRACQLQCSAFAAGSDDKTFGNKRDTLVAALSLWDDPTVCAATDASDFDLRRMREERLSVYLCASAGDLKVLRPLYATVFQLLYDQLTKVEPAKSDHGVLVILDEFARLGAMPDLQAAFALTRSYKVRFLIVVQSLNQLKDAKLYGVHGAEDISINCDTQIYFTPTRTGDAKELSEALGFQTVKSRSRSRQSRGGTSTSENQQQRALMLPQELMLFPEEEVLLKTRGRRAFRLHKLRAWSDGVYACRLAIKPPAVAALPIAAPPPSLTEAAIAAVAGHILAFGSDPDGEAHDAGQAEDEETNYTRSAVLASPAPEEDAETLDRIDQVLRQLEGRGSDKPQ